jgi:zinc protease
MRTFKAAFSGLACLLLIVGALPAQTPSQAGKAFSFPIKQYTLKNGLRVTLSEDHSAPTVSLDVAYNVGSRNERVGRTGFAHLFEHMMYQGSENVGKGEHFILVLNNGGGMNGTTNDERTTYFETLPANQLDLGLFLEADRMKSLAITKANLDNQRNAVQEERRQGLDNQPYGRTSEALGDTAYDNFAYKHSVIGSMEDLNAASVEDVSAFFKTYYAPNNAVVTLVGDFKPDEALAKIKKYFDAIPSQPAPPPVDTTEPPQKAERRKTLEDGFAQLTRIDIAYKIPPTNTPDWYAMDMLADILGSGQSSVLTQKLVKDKEVAVNIASRASQSRGTCLFQFFVFVRPGKTAEEVEKMIYEEIERAKTQAFSDTEIAKAKMGNRRAQIQQMQSTLSRAVLMGDAAVFYNDPTFVYARVDKYNAVTAADLMRVAKTYLNEANRTVITTVPKPKSAPAPARSGQ